MQEMKKSVAIKIGQDLIKQAGGIEVALKVHRDTSAAADVLFAHLYSLNPREAQRLARVYDPA